MGQWTRLREQRRITSSKLAEKIYSWMLHHGQWDNFEVTGEMFPRGSLRVKNHIQHLSFLRDFSRRSFCKRTCIFAIRLMISRFQIQPIRHGSESLDAYITRQAVKLQEISRKVLAAYRSQKYRSKKKIRAMDNFDTQPMDQEVLGLSI